MEKDIITWLLYDDLPLSFNCLKFTVSISFSVIDLMKHIDVQEADRVAEKGLGRTL
jgi:hypothetical protein